jgi:hypothetical protein
MTSTRMIEALLALAAIAGYAVAMSHGALL